MSNGVNQCAACGGLWGDDEPHVACPSDHPSDPTDKAVALLKTIGLDITYTDEGLRVVAEQIGRLYVTAPRTLTANDRAAIAKVLRDNGADSGTDMHDSWRCADKERYPEPCDCIDRLANSIMFTLIHDGEDR